MKSTKIVELIENTLGWAAPIGEPLWKVRSREAGKLNRKIATRPSFYTERNILLAIEYCRREHITIETPVGVLGFVEAAVREANKPEVERPLDQAIAEAIAWEQDNEQQGFGHWVTRLRRANGAARRDVLTEWKQARGL